MVISLFFFFQAEDGIRDLVRSRGLGDVYKRQEQESGMGSTCQLQVQGSRSAQCCIERVDAG